MDIDEMKAIVALRTQGSLLAAADSLQMSRTTLRRKLESLEARADVRLLERTRRATLLTPAGEALATHCENLLTQSNAALQAVREIGNNSSGFSRVIMPVGMPPQIVSGLFFGLRNLYPEFEVLAEFHEDPVGEMVNDYDIVLAYLDGDPAGDFLTEPLFRVRERALASAGYAERNGLPTTLEDLRNHTLINWCSPGLDSRCWPLLNGGSFLVQPGASTANLQIVHEIVVSGEAIGCYAENPMGTFGCSQGTLVPVLEDVIGRDLNLSLVVPRALADVPRVKAMMTLGRSIADFIA